MGINFIFYPLSTLNSRKTSSLLSLLREIQVYFYKSSFNEVRGNWGNLSTFLTDCSYNLKVIILPDYNFSQL